MSQPLLEIENLSHRFGERSVLNQVNVSVPEGCVVGLMGPNGSGKSTTLHVLTGLLRPEQGTFRLHGQPIAPGDRKLRKKSGVVFQSSSVDPKLSARENLKLSAALFGLRGHDASKRIEELLALVDLQSRADETIRTLSGGMRRRIDLIRALLHSPEILLLDEPTTGLDQTSFLQFWKHLDTLRGSNRLGVLMATHRAEEAELCDYLYILNEGHVVASGTPDELRKNVSGEIVTIETSQPNQVQSVLHTQFGVEAHLSHGALRFEHKEAYQLIPRIVEACGPNVIASIAMRRASLTDVFVALTGKSWNREAA